MEGARKRILAGPTARVPLFLCGFDVLLFFFFSGLFLLLERMVVFGDVFDYHDYQTVGLVQTTSHRWRGVLGHAAVSKLRNGSVIGGAKEKKKKKKKKNRK